MNIALTGGIGCGKSTVAAYFRNQGINVFCADEYSHAAIEYIDTKDALVNRWGATIIGEGGMVDRKKVGGIVFSSPSELNFLTGLIYAELYKAIECEKMAPGVNIFDIPLLFENHMEKLFDKTVAVWAPPAACRERVAAKWPEGEYDRRSALQMPSGEKLERADYGIVNNTSLDRLFSQCALLMQKFNDLPIIPNT